MNLAGIWKRIARALRGERRNPPEQRGVVAQTPPRAIEASTGRRCRCLQCGAILRDHDPRRACTVCPDRWWPGAVYPTKKLNREAAQRRAGRRRHGDPVRIARRPR